MAPHAQLSSGTVDSDGESIYWEMASTGDGDTRPVVVLSHGAGGSHAVWFQQVPALARDFRVLTWDSRGFGNSTNTNEAHSPESAAADLAAIMNEDMGDTTLAEELLYKRNANWAEWIDARLESTPGTVFIAVGAGHLAGQQSVQDYLAERDIETTRVQ